MFGKILRYEFKENKIIIGFENTIGIVEIINPWVINVFSPFKYEEHYSKVIEDLEIEPGSVSDCKIEDFIEIKTEALIIRVYNDFKVDFYDISGKLLCEDYRKEREPFIRRGNTFLAEKEGHKFEKANEKRKIEVIKRIFGDEKFYGLGEKTGHLNKKYYSYEMWNTDDPSAHTEEHKSLYKSIPFFITLREKAAFGIFFDNTFRTYFDMAKENSSYYYFGADDGNLDYYFIAGPDIKDVIGRYTKLTGRTPMPQLWTLGYQQCRYSYAPSERVMEVAEDLRKYDIPCDVIHLDIDYMDGYRVFTWDKKKFPDPKGMTERLKEKGFKVVTIIDPGVKKNKGYSIYDKGLKNGYFATDKDGVTYVNAVWPGDAVYPDFSDKSVREWWAENQKIMLESGVSGIWNDMNEPASFNGPLPDDVQFDNDGRPTDHREIHNVYGHFMAKATYEGLKKYTGKRPFVITRACYAGTQKYSTVWTGDNKSFWEHLRMAVPMLMNLGLSGVAFCGTDVGGFGFDCTGELLARWVQVGCFSPLFRNHSAVYTRDQEPWTFDEDVLNIYRKYVKLRYRLLPYMYDLMWQCENSGLPVMRPLVLHYPNDSKTYEMNDEFLCGENILVAPVVEQGKTFKAVYLPEGEWYDFWTKEVIKGKQIIIKDAPLDTCPMYIKSGSIIPNYPEMRYTKEKVVEELILDVYPGCGEYLHYQDDGESFSYRNGEYNTYKFTMKACESLEIDVRKEHSGYSKSYKGFKLMVNRKDIKSVSFNDKEIEFKSEENTIQFSVPAEDGKIIVK